MEYYCSTLCNPDTLITYHITILQGTMYVSIPISQKHTKPATQPPLYIGALWYNTAVYYATLTPLLLTILLYYRVPCMSVSLYPKSIQNLPPNHPSIQEHYSIILQYIMQPRHPYYLLQYRVPCVSVSLYPKSIQNLPPSHLSIQEYYGIILQYKMQP